MHVDRKSAKNTVKHSVFLALLGFACVKSARKMLVKSVPGGNGPPVKKLRHTSLVKQCLI